MIRLALKSAFFLGLAALVVPLGQTARDGDSRLDLFGALSGAQEALADIGGFCGRAPKACVAGRDFAAFAGERIEDGARLAYALIESRMDAPQQSGGDTAGTGQAPAIDPVATGAVLASPQSPRPYRPPMRRQSAGASSDSSGIQPQLGVSTPIPAARPAT